MILNPDPWPMTPKIRAPLYGTAKAMNKIFDKFWNKRRFP